MKIWEIKENKKQFLSLLLLADEQENMIDRYLERGTMYVLNDNGVKAECVVTDEGNGILEIKNIATVPEYQGKGYAKALIDFIVKEYADNYSVLQVGTGDSPLTVPFYEKCGFVRSYIIPNFFTDYYDHQPPTKTYEYILSGLVCVATSTYSNKKIITPTNGILHQDNAASFQNALETMLKNKEQYDSQLIRESLHKYQWENIIKESFLPIINSI